MKKRILSLLLCLLLLFPLVLTSCGEKKQGTTEEPEEAKITVPATLNFYIIKDARTTEESIAIMEQKFNDVAEQLYKTHVNFFMYTADEYEEKVLGKLQSAASVQGESAADWFSREFADGPKTERDEHNLPREIYPEIRDNQVDILLIAGRDMYDRFNAAGYLQDITAIVDADNTFSSHINPALLSGAREDGKLYAVPNNVLIGKYTYLLINRDLVDLTYQGTSASGTSPFLKYDGNANVLDYDKCYSFAETLLANSDLLTRLKSKNAEKYGHVDKLYPLKAPFAFPTLHTYSYAGENTFLGTVYNYYSGNATGASSLSDVVNILAPGSTYRSYLAFMTSAKERQYYPALMSETDMYAMQVVKCTYTELREYEKENYCYLLDCPRLDDDEPFNAMFAVSSYSVSAQRSLEIIRDLLANSKAELRNILQYGDIEDGTDYSFNEENGTVTRNNSCSYFMNNQYTGNIAIVYPCLSDPGVTENFLYDFKTQNEAARRNPLYGLTNEKAWKHVIDRTQQNLMAEKYKEGIRVTINSLPYSSDMLQAKYNVTGEPFANITQLRTYLLKQIPASASPSEYRNIWKYIKADIDPGFLALPDELNAMIKENALLNTRLTNAEREIKALSAGFEGDSRVESEAFVQKTVRISAEYTDRVMNATTRAEFETACDAIEKMLDNGQDPSNIYFKNASTSATGKAPYGMLRLYRDTENPANTDSSSLRGFVFCWSQGFIK